jgi:putative hemolysin
MELSPIGGILIVLLLVLANGFFVAAEFALVSARPTRIDRLAASGNFAARLVQAAQADPNRFISAAQLGITVASLLLGWLGEETFARLLHAPLGRFLPDEGAWLTAHGLASAGALILITFLHITLGEQVPKMLALQRAETVVMLAAPPTAFLARIFQPFIAVLYGFTNLVLRLLGLEFHAEEHAVHSPEELRLLVGRSAKAGLISAPERDLVERAFAFGDLTAGEMMVPRTELVGIPVNASMRDAVRIARRHRHTRFPVYDGTIDNVVGVLSAKDLLGLRDAPSAGGAQPAPNLRRLVRPPVVVPQGALVSDVLARMKSGRQPLAVVLDEYGSTAGVVTLRDMIGRLVGDVGDEHAPPVHEIRMLGDGSTLADGLALVEDVNAQLGTHFDTSEVDTLGGLVFSELGRRPVIGDEVDLGSGYDARVERLDGLRIARVRLVPHEERPLPEAR